jgi:hypothetical protein
MQYASCPTPCYDEKKVRAYNKVATKLAKPFAASL